MKKIVTIAAMAFALALASGEAWAQCCNVHTVTGEQCGEIDPTVSRTAGCTDAGGGNCIGGRLDGPQGPEGCVCVNGACEAGGRNFSAGPVVCGNRAATACCDSVEPNGTCS